MKILRISNGHSIVHRITIPNAIIKKWQISLEQELEIKLIDDKLIIKKLEDSNNEKA